MWINFVFLLSKFILVWTSCPLQSNTSISGSIVLSTDAYQSSAKTAVLEVCKLHFSPVNSNGFMVSITQFFLFSHRQPKNTREIVIKNDIEEFVIKPEAKIYKYFNGSIEIELPMNLNFRALLTVTVTRNCSVPTSFRCLSNTSVCVSRDYLCDENDNCGEVVNCSETKKNMALTSFEYDREAISSSQIMLIGFFLLNLAFIVFFLILSLCSAGYCLSSKIYLKQNRASRRTFAQYIREASVEQPLTVSKQIDNAEKPSLIEKKQSPVRKISGERRHRPSILSRINFEPAPSLREQEPEVEDRATISPIEELCAPPTHRHELFLRRQTLPALYPTSTNVPKKNTWKRASVGGGRLL